MKKSAFHFYSKYQTNIADSSRIGINSEFHKTCNKEIYQEKQNILLQYILV